LSVVINNRVFPSEENLICEVINPMDFIKEGLSSYFFETKTIKIQVNLGCEVVTKKGTEQDIILLPERYPYNINVNFKAIIVKLNLSNVKLNSPHIEGGLLLQEAHIKDSILFCRYFNFSNVNRGEFVSKLTNSISNRLQDKMVSEKSRKLESNIKSQDTKKGVSGIIYSYLNDIGIDISVIYIP